MGLTTSLTKSHDPPSRIWVLGLGVWGFDKGSKLVIRRTEFWESRTSTDIDNPREYD